ncbi:hypothetical protein [Streptomyces sp. NPDC048639]|uniref:hypothetical protein n=1 Tax=Streptomyces sp. NPDC048639 TaxID=3365581 RepID=UPI00371F8158
MPLHHVGVLVVVAAGHHRRSPPPADLDTCGRHIAQDGNPQAMPISSTVTRPALLTAEPCRRSG